MNLLAKICLLPRALRMGLMYAEAAADVECRRYLEAEKKLLKLQASLPPRDHSPAPATLLLSLVYVRLSRFEESAIMALEAIKQARSIVRYVHPAERDYMIYVGKILYEHASRLAGKPMTVDVGVVEKDLRPGHVRALLREQFPLAWLTTCESSPLH